MTQIFFALRLWGTVTVFFSIRNAAYLGCLFGVCVFIFAVIIKFIIARTWFNRVLNNLWALRLAQSAALFCIYLLRTGEFSHWWDVKTQSCHMFPTSGFVYRLFVSVLLLSCFHWPFNRRISSCWVAQKSRKIPPHPSASLPEPHSRRILVLRSERETPLVIHSLRGLEIYFIILRYWMWVLWAVDSCCCRCLVCASLDSAIFFPSSSREFQHFPLI